MVERLRSCIDQHFFAVEPFACPFPLAHRSGFDHLAGQVDEASLHANHVGNQFAQQDMTAKAWLGQCRV